ncbi:MAG: hypothetical protein B5M56_04250 [Desulfococcus sp. 4484_241]|nr:MAG: hypothetical protein B5M56_04250 [Desulfococcus sp. 4484_241]
MAKNFYAVLGVTSQSTDEEIKSAYRRLSKEFHPDRYSGSSDIFLKIQEAYSVLGDPQKRREYDRRTLRKIRQPVSNFRPSYRFYPGPEPLIPEENPLDFGQNPQVRSFESVMQYFDEVFDWLWRHF